MLFGTVTGTAPLLVRTDGAATALPAKVVSGVGYAPTVGGRVLVASVGGRLFVLGGL